MGNFNHPSTLSPDADGIAIVGMACRFPAGINSPAALWDFVSRGGDAVTEVPDDRWDADEYFDPVPGTPDKSYSRWGAFLEKIDGFDHAFFGISARERDSMDPQQRLLMEVTWEALENGGIAPSSMRQVRAGVYVGISGFDHALRQLRSTEHALNHGFVATGSAHSVAAGRLSYFLGLTGPALAIDTACSSALVAVHQGVRALRHGEVEAAICGAVNLTLLPEGHVVLSQARMLSPSGRCRAFAANADGYVRGEGAGVVILRRLGDALRDGQRVLAVIRGTAVNQDGRTSGLTAPSGVAQVDLIRDALSDARLAPHDVDVIEAHGTGTALGDPIELRALGRVFGETAREHPLVVTSVKTNIGHLESAAGMAGLIRAVEGLRRAQVAPHLHFTEPTTAVDWRTLPLRVPTALEPWPIERSVRRIGVSSFGFSGTNAHAVVESWPNDRPQQSSPSVTANRSSQVLVLSAATSRALEETCGRLADFLEACPNLRLTDVSYTLGEGRSALAERVAVVVPNHAAAADALRKALSTPPDGLSARARHASGVTPLLAFAFPGQGAQYVGMARELAEQEPLFNDALANAIAQFDPLLPAPLAEVMSGRASSLSLDDTRFTQPALFAVGHALATWWMSRGVRPGVLLGHSVGEYVAACIAGVFTLPDAARLVAARARLMAALPKTGGMLSVFAPVEQVLPFLRTLEHAVGVGAVNGPEHTVLSGDAATLETLQNVLQENGIGTRKLSVSHAFHSPLVESMLHDFRRELESVRMGAPHTTLVSNVTGGVVTEEVTNPDYWIRHVRQPVQFDASVTCLHELGVRAVLEAGPSGVLATMGRRTSHGKAMRWIPSLVRGRDDRETQLEAIANLFVIGCPLDWAAILPPDARRIELPVYPFQHEATSPEAQAAEDRSADHPDRWMLRERWIPEPVRLSADDGPVDLAGDWRLWGIDSRAVSAVGAHLRAGGGSVETDRARWGEARSWRGTLLVLGSADRKVSAGLPELDPLLDVAMAFQSVATALAPDGTRTWVVTCAAHEVDESPVQPLQSGLWAMAGTVAREVPELDVRRLDVAGFDADDLAGLTSTLLRQDAEERLALRNGTTYVARLVAVTAAPADVAASLRTDAAYLITGGLGALGLVTAEWLVGEGVQHVLLVSRRQPDGDTAKAVGRLRESGTRVTVLNADIADADGFADALGDALMGGPPLRGIFHAAGVLADTLLRDLTRERVARVARPKIGGAITLMAYQTRQPLDFVVYFSSIAALLGSPGQANYALVNGVLDGAARRLNADGLRVLSVNWTSWTGAGMAARLDPRHLRRQRAAGIGSLTPQDGTRALRYILERVDGAQVAVLPMHASDGRYRVDPYFTELVPSAHATETARTSTDWAALSTIEVAPRLVHWLQSLLADVLDAPIASIEPDRSIMELGLDSLASMEIRNRIQTELGCRIPVATLLHGPTIKELAHDLVRQLRREVPDGVPVLPHDELSDNRRDLETLEF